MKKTETWLWLDVRTMQSHGTSWSSLRWMMSPTFKISNMRDNTARHYCVTLIQRQPVWEMNWRIGKPWIIHVYIDSKCLNRENGKWLWKTNLDVHAFAHAGCFPLDNRNFQRVCPVVLFVPGMKFGVYRLIYFHSYELMCRKAFPSTTSSLVFPIVITKDTVWGVKGGQ